MHGDARDEREKKLLDVKADVQLPIKLRVVNEGASFVLESRGILTSNNACAARNPEKSAAKSNQARWYAAVTRRVRFSSSLLGCGNFRKKQSKKRKKKSFYFDIRGFSFPFTRPGGYNAIDSM